MNSAIRIAIVDDHKLFVDGLVNLFSQVNGIEVCGVAFDGNAALSLIENCHPEIVIMDITMPQCNGLLATHHIKKDHPETSVIILSMHSNRKYVEEALKAGASGYILKDSAFDEILDAIEQVATGKLYLSESISEMVINQYASSVRSSPGGASGLSARETEVLQLLAEGNSTREIAELLHVSVKTVETHRKQIMDKLQIKTVAGLTKYALKEGITTL